MDTKKEAAAIRALLDKVERVEESSEKDRWTIAERMNRLVTEHGMSRKALAAEVGKSDKYVGVMVRLWEEFAHSKDRPRFWVAYNEVGGSTTSMSNTSTEQRAERVARELRDPEVAERVVRHPQAAPAITRAQVRKDQEDRAGHDRRRAEVGLPPASRSSEGDYASLGHSIRTIAKLVEAEAALHGALVLLKEQGYHPEAGDDVDVRVKRISAVLADVILFIEAGDSEKLDAAIESLLSEGGR